VVGCPTISFEDTFTRQHLRFAAAEYRFAEADNGLATHSNRAHSSHGGVAHATGSPAPAAGFFAGGTVEVLGSSVTFASPAGERTSSPNTCGTIAIAFAAR